MVFYATTGEILITATRTNRHTIIIDQSALNINAAMTNVLGSRQRREFE
jgi:hypothetical protein